MPDLGDTLSSSLSGWDFQFKTKQFYAASTSIQPFSAGLNIDLDAIQQFSGDMVKLAVLDIIGQITVEIVLIVFGGRNLGIKVKGNRAIRIFYLLDPSVHGHHIIWLI